MRENFSENLKEARLNANMTQAEVAKAVGVAKNTYCNWERGTREPNILKIKALAKLFGISVDYLVGLEAVSEVAFEDDGHAIAWAMQQ